MSKSKQLPRQVIIDNCYDETYFMLSRSKSKGKSMLTYFSHHAPSTERAYTLVFDENHDMVYDSGFQFSSNLSKKVAESFVKNGVEPNIETINILMFEERESIRLADERSKKAVEDLMSRVKQSGRGITSLGDGLFSVRL